MISLFPSPIFSLPMIQLYCTFLLVLRYNKFLPAPGPWHLIHLGSSPTLAPTRASTAGFFPAKMSWPFPIPYVPPSHSTPLLCFTFITAQMVTSILHNYLSACLRLSPLTRTSALEARDPFSLFVGVTHPSTWRIISARQETMNADLEWGG